MKIRNDESLDTVRERELYFSEINIDNNMKYKIKKDSNKSLKKNRFLLLSFFSYRKL